MIKTGHGLREALRPAIPAKFIGGALIVLLDLAKLASNRLNKIEMDRMVLLDKNYSDLARRNASNLLRLYDEKRHRFKFARTLEFCLQAEAAKLSELRSIYTPQLKDVTFLSGKYFDHHSRLLRHQDIDPRFFIKQCQQYFFVSHRWLSASDPDPDSRQFAVLKSQYDHLEPSVQSSAGFWYDYSCVPQASVGGERTPAEQRRFENTLKLMHLLASLDTTMILYEPGYLGRSWCCWEWLLATRISPIAMSDEAAFPFGKFMKFRHIALLILALNLDISLLQPFMEGSDHALGFINTVVMSTIGQTQATYQQDKDFLSTNIMKHFWYNLRFIGVRTELMIAMLLFAQYRDRDERSAQALLEQFLLISGDPELKWLNQVTLHVETQVLAGMPLDEHAVFHREEIHVKSKSLVQEINDRSATKYEGIYSALKTAEHFQSQGQVPAALAAYRACSLIAEQKLHASPNDIAIQNVLWMSYRKTGEILIEQNDLRGALEVLRKDVAVVDRLAKVDPNQRINPAFVRVSMGYVLRDLGELAEALKTFKTAEKILDELLQADANNADGLTLRYRVRHEIGNMTRPGAATEQPNNSLQFANNQGNVAGQSRNKNMYIVITLTLIAIIALLAALHIGF